MSRTGHAGSWSLRSRLMALAGVACLLAWAAGGAAILLSAREESRRLYEEHLREVARVILSFATHEIEEIRGSGRTDIVHEETAVTLDPRYRYQVWSRDGKLLLISHGTRSEAFAPLGTAGLVRRSAGPETLSVYSAWSEDGGMLIQVAEDEALRAPFFISLDRWLVVFFAGSTLLLVLLNWWMFSRATRALDQSARQLLDRSAEDLRPIAVLNPPRELTPLLDSINRLFGRFERTLDSERRFTASAAHELRTPLAAVRVQAQVAQRARSPAELRQALEDLGVCVERASRMIDQLVTLARVENESTQRSMVPLRVDTVAQAVVNDLRPLLHARKLQVQLDLRPCRITGIEFGVAVLLRNLVDNAARYSPPEGKLLVETGEIDGECCAAVEDSGPGIPLEERERVFTRFYRPANAAVDGCGVGLSIVRSVVRAHGARIDLSDSRLGGLRAAVFFSKAADA